MSVNPKAVLFLDIDGVLNRHDTDLAANCNPIHRAMVEKINWVLFDTSASIVLSSAWRYHIYRGEMTLAGLDWLLRSHGLMENRLIGITRSDTTTGRLNPFSGNTEDWPNENERGQQISDWVDDNDLVSKKIPYAVVDDLDLGISKASHPFVKTDSSVGITWPDAYALRDLLLKEPK